MSTNREVFAKAETLKGSFLELGKGPFTSPAREPFFVRMGTFNKEGVFRIQTWTFMFHQTAHAVFESKLRNIFTLIAKREGVHNG